MGFVIRLHRPPPRPPFYHEKESWFACGAITQGVSTWVAFENGIMVPK